MAGSFGNSSTSVTTSVTQIAEINSTNAWLELRNVGSVTVYLGGSSVAVTDGYPLHPGERFTVVAAGNLDVIIYGITESGTADIRAILA